MELSAGDRSLGAGSTWAIVLGAAARNKRNNAQESRTAGIMNSSFRIHKDAVDCCSLLMSAHVFESNLGPPDADGIEACDGLDTPQDLGFHGLVCNQQLIDFRLVQQPLELPVTAEDRVAIDVLALEVCVVVQESNRDQFR